MKKLFVSLVVLILSSLIIFAGCAKENAKTGAGVGEGENRAGIADTGQSSAGNAGGIDLTNIKNLGSLLALGKSIVCDVSTRQGGRNMMLRYYIKGQKYRVEGTTNEGSFAVIRPNDGFVYIKPITGTVPVQIPCEWFKFEEAKPEEVPEMSGPEMSSGSVQTPVDINWKCYEQAIDESKFVAPANACSFEEILRRIGGIGVGGV
ncbi:MAG: hypothetical protein QXG39_10020 [Candidatus Aenigmatarchaeota archaeon]